MTKPALKAFVAYLQKFHELSEVLIFGHAELLADFSADQDAPVFHKTQFSRDPERLRGAEAVVILSSEQQILASHLHSGLSKEPSCSTIYVLNDCDRTSLSPTLLSLNWDMRDLAFEGLTISMLFDQGGSFIKRPHQTLAQEPTSSQEPDNSTRKLQQLRYELRRARARIAALENSRSYKIGNAFARSAQRLWPLVSSAIDKLQPAAIYHNLKHRISAAEREALKIVVERPPALVAEAGVIDWSIPASRDKPVVLAVMDEFTAKCFEPNIELVRPRPDNWLALAEGTKPDLVFIESAWQGNGGSWQYRVGEYKYMPGNEVAQMLMWAREHGVPSVFWNKEDPVHTHKFMSAAIKADHIFTTDSNSTKSYAGNTKRASIDVLPFAAQPALHRPGGMSTRAQKICFAGSWCGEKYPLRTHEMFWLLNAASDFDLEIFDRNYDSEEFRFPKEFEQNVKGRLPYDELCKKYREYRVFLNVNSVVDSPTMFSRRVFEIMASGTPIVSTHSRGIEELFGRDIVWLVNDESEARLAIKTLMENDQEWERRSLRGVREVFSNHTYADRLGFILRRLNIKREQLAEPKIAVILEAKDDAELAFGLAFKSKQSYRNFDLIINTGLTPDLPAGAARLIQTDSTQELLEVILETGAGLAGRISPQITYGSHYLRDLVNAAKYCPNADGWAKAITTTAFRFGAETLSTTAIWSINKFSECAEDSCNERISAERLYVIDSTEIELRSDWTCRRNAQ